MNRGLASWRFGSGFGSVGRPRCFSVQGFEHTDILRARLFHIDDEPVDFNEQEIEAKVSGDGDDQAAGGCDCSGNERIGDGRGFDEGEVCAVGD